MREQAWPRRVKQSRREWVKGIRSKGLGQERDSLYLFSQGTFQSQAKACHLQSVLYEGQQ